MQTPMPTVAEALHRVSQRQLLVGLRAAPHVAAFIENHLVPALGHIPLDQLSTETIEAFAAQQRAAGFAPSTINCWLWPLRAACKLYGNERGLRVPLFPHLEARNAREVFFERSEFERAVGHLRTPLQPPMWFSYYTGWRVHSEVLPLRWDEHIKWDSGTIVLPAVMTKGKRSRVFPFAPLPALADLLRTQRESTPPHVPWVFHRFGGKQIRNFWKAWRHAITTAKLGHKVPHDLRRTAARNLIRSGVPEKVVMELVGWTTDSMLKRYHIVREDDLRDAVSRLAQRVSSMIILCLVWCE